MSSRLTLAALRRSAHWTGLRSRIGDGVQRGVVSLPVVLVYGVGALTFIKVAQPSNQVEFWLGLVAVGLVLGWAVLVVVNVLRRRPPGHGAQLLDRHHQLDGRLSNALEFSELPVERQSPLMRVAIDDALARIQKVSPRAAAPFPIPRELGVVAFLCLGLCAVALLEVRVLRYVAPPTNDFKPMVMTGDDLELFRDLASELQHQDDPETLAAVRRFNQLIEDISQRRLERREVFQRLANLEKDLTKAGEAEREASEEGLKGLAHELEKSDLSKPVADALKEKRLADAEKAMQELAEKLKNKRQAPSKAQLERLRKSLERASKASAERNQSLLEQKDEIEKEKKRLLDKKKKGEELSKSEQKKLDQLERQLERLDREKKKSERAQKQMSELDRKLAEAARDLMQAQGASAEDLESAAEDLNRMGKKEQTEEQKQELLKRLQEMREILRQQGAGGQKRMQRMMRFGQRARGQSGGQPGGNPGGQQGEGQGEGEGKGPGQGQGQGPGEITPMLVPGKGGGEVPGAGQGSGPGQGQGQGQEGPPGGGGPGGKQWGTGHDDKIAGDNTQLKGQTKDVVAAGVDTGEGNASSEVIYGAAQRGFVGRGYQKVYTDYQTVAERVMNQDEIPPGYRFYVRRYFQLIRPRE